METFVKNSFAKISLAAQMIWVAQNLGEGGLAAPELPRPVRLWVLYHLFLQSNILKFQINFISVRCLVKAWLCVVKSAW